MDGLSVSRRLVYPSVLDNRRLGQRLVQAEGSSIFSKCWLMVVNDVPIDPFMDYGLNLVDAHCLDSVDINLQRSSSRALDWSLGSHTRTFKQKNQLKHTLYTLPPNFMDFRLLKASQISQSMLVPLELLSECHGCSWTFWFLNFLNDLYSLK